MEKCAPSERQARKEQQDNDLRWLMGDRRGRRLMMRILSGVGMYRSTYDPGLKDVPSEMLFREGQKNVGYRLMSEINRVCPETYFQMMKEANDGGRSGGN